MEQPQPQNQPSPASHPSSATGTGLAASATELSLTEVSLTELSLLEQGDRTSLFQHFLAKTQGCREGALPFLDAGMRQSPYGASVSQFPVRLTQCPPSSPIDSVPRDRDRDQDSTPTQPYPVRGQQPKIDETGLDFLHGDIQQACVCLGEWADGQLQTRWLGRQARHPIELWSTTKLVPLLNLVAQANTIAPDINIRDCYIREQGTHKRHLVYDLATDIMTYDETIGTSNAIAAMLKLFTPPLELEQWLQHITGNTALEFRGRYGEPPFFDQPELWHPITDQVLLTGQPVTDWQDNTVATYDLTRLLSMVGWHPHLSSTAQLPGIQWPSLMPLIQAMGQDSARYLDVAIATLGLGPSLHSPVILSKLGYGRSSIRDRAEFSYTAFVQWWDQPLVSTTAPTSGRAMAFTLLAAKDHGDFNREVVELDARMATEVTELVRRLAQRHWD